MPYLSQGHKFILCIIDQVMNCLIMVPIYQSKADSIIMDQDSAFMLSLMNYLFNKFDIKIKTVAPYNHQLFQAEH